MSHDVTYQSPLSTSEGDTIRIQVSAESSFRVAGTAARYCV